MKNLLPETVGNWAKSKLYQIGYRCDLGFSPDCIGNLWGHSICQRLKVTFLMKSCLLNYMIIFLFLFSMETNAIWQKKKKAKQHYQTFHAYYKGNLTLGYVVFLHSWIDGN